MEKDSSPSMADFLHLRGNELAKGDPLVLPLVQSSMYHLPGLAETYPFYGRVSNPTWEALETSLSHLEGAPCLSFPSGMAAITAALFANLKAGNRLLIPSDGYYVTRLLSSNFLANLAIEVEERATSAFLEGGFEGFDVVLVESPSNPGLDVVDLRQVASHVQACGGISLCDNTTLTPLGQRPLDLGFDLVVSSDTKSMGGHCDLLMGHVASRRADLMEPIKSWRTISGSIPGPHEAWLLHRGLETLEVRYERMCASALIIAQRLADHKAVQAIRFPGLPTDPSYSIATAQQRRYGFLIALTLESEDKAEDFITHCPLLRPATSFGGLHSSAERRARWGDAVDPAFVRLSVGCEPVEELWDALCHSLDQL
ncbi:MAG: cystathionine gamma-lyase [Cohaesibacter sp.]|nr:cystathionine gamma-lyase [Cohaesibacter sp.]